MSIRNELLEQILAATGTGQGVASVTGDSVDNTDPLNPVVNAPADAPTDTGYVLQGADWIPAHKSSLAFRLVWNNNTIDPPLNGEVRGNNSDLALISELKVSNTAGNFADISFITKKLSTNNTIYGAVDQNDLAFAGYTITGDVVDMGSWVSIPVVAETSGVNANDGDILLIEVIATDVQFGHYLGVYTDLAALQLAHPVGMSGDTATVTNPNGNLFYWNAAWLDSGTGYNGDMLKSVYDPSLKSANAFSMANMDETAVAKILTNKERDKLAGIEALAEVNNISDVNATALTDGGETTLHSHAQPVNPHLSGHLSTNLTFDVGLEEKVIALDTTTKSNGITLSAGEFEVGTNGNWLVNLTLQIKETSDPTYLVWFEVKPLATGAWELANGGVDKVNITKLKTDQNWTMFISEGLDLLAGDKFRISAMITSNSDKVELKQVTQAVSLGTLTQNSAFIEVVKASNG